MTSTDHKALRVLVVEDESLMRWAIAETLGPGGHIVVEASDASTALRALAGASPAMDVVLLDYCLPDSQDLGLLERVRELSSSSAVVMMTAHGTPETTAGALERGADDVLSKPFEIHDLEAVLRKARISHLRHA